MTLGTQVDDGPRQYASLGMHEAGEFAALTAGSDPPRLRGYSAILEALGSSLGPLWSWCIALVAGTHAGSVQLLGGTAVVPLSVTHTAP